MSHYFYNKLHHSIGFMISVLVLLSCVYNYIEAPKIMCILNVCNNSTVVVMVSMFPRALAIACMISRFTVMYKNISTVANYNKKIKEYEVYYPITVDKENSRRFLIIVFVFIYCILILPVNIYRLYLIYYYYKNFKVTVFISLMYIQNVSMSMTELHFLVYCFGLYVKFQSINEDLSAIKSETISTNRYPFVLKSEEHKSIEVRPSVRSIELLKMRHQFVCQSVSDLNEIYSIQLGMSISVLFIMLLFDIYEAVATKLVKTKSFLLLYGWLTQYIFRFAIVILMSHITTKQVIIVDSRHNKLYNIIILYYNSIISIDINNYYKNTFQTVSER